MSQYYSQKNIFLKDSFMNNKHLLVYFESKISQLSMNIQLILSIEFVNRNLFDKFVKYLFDNDIDLNCSCITRNRLSEIKNWIINTKNKYKFHKIWTINGQLSSTKNKYYAVIM